jgi:hypothetical protein
MFSYEENEKVVNKAIMKCLNERFEFGGFDEPESFSGNTTGGMSIKQGYEIPKKIDIRLEITSKDKNEVVGDVSLKDPETGKPLHFSGVRFVRIIDEEADDPSGYFAYEYPETKGGWAMYCPDNVDNYDLYNEIISPLVKDDEVKIIKVLTKLVKKGSISLPNPFFKKK